MSESACLPLLCICVLALNSAAGAPDYQDVTKWEEVAVPPKSDAVARELWWAAAAESPDEWRVFMENGSPRAKLDPERGTESVPRPFFSPPLQALRGIETYAAVDHDWIIGVNRGEFGSDVYWYNHDGTSSYRISAAHIVAFFSRPDGVYAIEGMSHLTGTRGSIIRFVKAKPTEHWKQETVLQFPSKPYAISLRNDGTMLLTMEDSILVVSSDLKIETLLSNAAWSGFYPSSSVLTQDEHTLYIGMRQFVGEFDLDTKKVRLLIPSGLFLNRLSKEEEMGIRKQYGN